MALLAWLLLLTVGFLLGAPLTIGIISAVLLAAMSAAALKFMRDPQPEGEKRIDALAGFWVLACYLLAGGIPLLPQGWTP